MTDGNKEKPSFDLLKIWINEGLENDLESYLAELLKLINELIKKYSESDDYGEYSKKIELWNKIIVSKEIKDHINSNDSIAIIDKYGISKEDLKKRKGASNSFEEVNFKETVDNVLIHSNGIEYYRKISSLFNGSISSSNERMLSNITHKIINKKDFNSKEINIENNFINQIRVEKPNIFDELFIDSEMLLNDTLNFIIQKYNETIASNQNLKSEFDKINKIKSIENFKFTSVFSEIGVQLEKGIPPNIKQLYYASHSFKRGSNNQLKKVIDVDKIIINEILMRKMIEWDKKMKILSDKERQYIVDFAYGLKNLNEFHRSNISGHLKTLTNSGFIF
jgi:hypothetical protein